MTYTTTHLGISTLAVFFLMPKKIKEYLKQNPRIFFLVSLGAILPDLDLFTNGHRAYLHSLFYPLILFIIAPFLEKTLSKDKLSINTRIFALFWLSHMIYDTTFGPIALFFPVDTRFYDITAGITFDLTTTQITPNGLFFGIRYVDQRTGIESFFVNWTPEQRVQNFGSEVIRWSITDFFVHTTLIIWYIGFIILPLISDWRNKKLSSNKLPLKNEKEVSLEFPMLHKWSLPIFLLLLTFASFLSGPVHGPTWHDNSVLGTDLGIANDFIQPFGGLTFTVPTNSKFSLRVTGQDENLEYSIFAVAVNFTSKESLSSINNDLIIAFDEGELNFTTYEEAYQNFTNLNINQENIAYVNTTQPIQWEFESDEDLYLIYGLYQWQQGISFRNSLRFYLDWELDISNTYRNGWIITIISASTTIVTFFIVNQRKNNITQL